MGKTFSSAFAICLLVSALPLACGDDEEGGGGGGKGKGGSSGSGTGGSAGGGATGGSAGGGATGGSGGAAGRGGTGGAAGRGGAGAGGMTGGTAGMDDGGMGGMDSGGEGGMPDTTGGVGGEGGSDTPPAPLCERYCDAGAVANCVNDRTACITTCEYNVAYGGTQECVDLMTALYECHITGNNWTCNQNQPTYGGTACMTQAMAAATAACL